jgi:hypothetical protein
MSEEETQPAGLGEGIVADTHETAQPTESTESTGLDFSSPETYKQFVDTLPEDIRGYKAFSETENLQSLANQLVNAQSALGKKRLEAPQEDWNAENWNEFYSQLRPENDEYTVSEIGELTLPDELQGQTIELPDEGIQQMVDLAGQMGLTQQQFDVMYQTTVENLLKNNQDGQVGVTESLKTYKAALSADWQDSFDTNIKQSKEAFTALAQEIPELNELVQDPTIANHPGMLKLFHKLATATGDLVPSMSNDPANGFGENSAISIQAQIRDIDSTNQELIMSEPAMLKPADRAKRDQILQKRTELYSKLYS